MGLFLTGTDFIVYAVQPLPLRMIGAWIIADTVKMTIAGMLLAGIYRASKNNDLERSRRQTSVSDLSCASNCSSNCARYVE